MRPILLATALAVCLSPLPLLAEDGPPYTDGRRFIEAELPFRVINEMTGRVNARSGPGLDHPVIGQFKPGTSGLMVTACDADATWCEFQLGEDAGLSINMKFVEAYDYML
jgi:hypothetical protein